jgi:hypothetical protein
MEQQTNGSPNGSDIWAALSRPFSFDAVHIKVQATNREKTRGLIVPYIDARAVMDRLDEVVGPDGWSDSYTPLEGGAVRCSLRIGKAIKEDVGQGDDAKAAFSDALKRTAVKFGVSRYLYDSEKIWADLNERGQIVSPSEVKQRVLSRTPERPNPHRPRRSLPRSSDEMAMNGDSMPI